MLVPPVGVITDSPESSIKDVQAVWARLQLSKGISDMDITFVPIRPRHEFTMDILIEGRTSLQVHCGGCGEVLSKLL